jgi:hypothetical protein
VIETPAGTKFDRVKGIGTVEPFQAHLDFMIEHLYEASATFRPQLMDAQVAESGIARAIRFMPTMAKLEERDFFGVARLKQFFFDWKNWTAAFEGQLLTGDINVILGDKLPQDKSDTLNVLNNLLDRKAVSKKWYREQVSDLYGMEIPANMDTEIEAEIRAAAELQQAINPQPAPAPPGGNQSNNRNRTNESNGTEARGSSERR